MDDFVFRGSLEDLDPAVYELMQLEEERQARKLIMIASESMAPQAVREGLGSAFQHLYAEGYPDEETRFMSEPEIMDFPARLAHYRRYSDPRYYKGVEYADQIEALARRRCAELFATEQYPPERLFVNVQPLSGAPANNAVFTALLSPGDTILGMSLLHGGHLTHGSSVNRSGKLFNAVHYTVDPQTEQIDYDAVLALALEHKPKIIIAGYSSYSWSPDWARFREIANQCGALLLADVSHIAGLIAAQVLPSPVGLAHIITFTTHKTLTGPRGAVILTTDAALARKLDRAVFPGEQGGPHVHVFAALATAFKLAASDRFRKLQQQIVENSKALNDRLAERGFRMSYGGTDTHLTNLDCKSVKGSDGTALSGDMAARILDLAGIVVNRNTIPGDKSALNASGIRLGTTWLTQRGFQSEEMRQVADIIADVLQATMPYSVESRQGVTQRAKIDFVVLEAAKLRVRALTGTGNDSTPIHRYGYPHFYYIDDAYQGQWVNFDLSGANVEAFASYAFTSDVEALQPGTQQKTCLVTPQGTVEATLQRTQPHALRLTVPAQQAGLAAAWLRALSDGYVQFDPDLTRRMPGPVLVSAAGSEPAPQTHSGEAVANEKPYYIGIKDLEQPGEALPDFTWADPEGAAIRRTALYDTHKALGARMVPFAGWEMPVEYSSIVEEHLATRRAAGLFDVSHMGVYHAEGPQARAFLDSVCGNDISALDVGQSLYTQFLDPDSNVIDDAMVYRRGEEVYMVVVNASNDDKDWAWLNAVKAGTVRIDRERPWVKAFGRGVTLRNMRDPQQGAEMLVDIALQGPKSREILLSLGVSAQDRKKIMALKRTELCDATVGGLPMVVSRTGYTGERMAFELLLHPDKTPELWQQLMEKGTPVGLKPCGLGARDSLRTEAGLPLYGHEMAGERGLGVAEGGFGSYVKVYKPWFIGRDAFIARERTRKTVVARFHFPEKGVRKAHPGDPVLDLKGRVIGFVTSCAIDSQGLWVGQACIDVKMAVEGTPISIFTGAPKTAGKPPVDLASGDRVTLPTPAVVISRFPKL